MFDFDARPAVVNALMLSAFTLCYVPFASLLVYHSPPLSDALLLHVLRTPLTTTQ